MKRYRLLKHIDNEDWNEIEIWKQFELTDYFHFNDWQTIPVSFLIREWYIEEIKEELKPKFKVWDYAVWKYGNRYVKIIDIHFIDNSFKYNSYWDWYHYKECNLRFPTKEELEKYFR